MLYVKETTGSVEHASRRLFAAAADRGLQLVGRHVMKWNSQTGAGVRRECRVYEFTNIVKVRRILDCNVAAVAFPCRVAVDGAYGAVLVSALRPTEILRATGFRDTSGPAEALERALLGAIDEVCGPAEKSEQIAERLVSVTT